VTNCFQIAVSFGHFNGAQTESYSLEKGLFLTWSCYAIHWVYFDSAVLWHWKGRVCNSEQYGPIPLSLWGTSL